MLGLRDTAEVTKPDGFEYYHYAPSMAAAILFIVLFAISTSVHMAQMIRSRTWFMIPFVIGGVLETIGYVGRALSANETEGEWTLGPYIIQTLMTLIAPAFLAASIYMELGRIVIMINGEKVLFIRRAWLTKIFVGGDVLSFLMQASGGGMMSGDSISSINMGQTLVVAGLFVQVVFFGLFLIAAGLFHFRILQMPTTKSYELAWWKKHMLSLYVVSGLIFVRSIVRVVEYLQGFDGYIMTHEAFIYVFDATLMIIAVVIMNVIHPGEVAKEVRAAKSGRLEDKDGVGMNLMSA
ncbi:hypothetical protein LTR97_004568 [Elasticomyces elasticus]|uniref:Uncharacterized protein n=1 Tax=Elasticomyces elasticus TaxID=574655 RepID=A0AAN7W8Q2_9PEZI|nr:hypothetical protein LTR97_004568 [Elasticomyces elasticus]